MSNKHCDDGDDHDDDRTSRAPTLFSLAHQLMAVMSYLSVALMSAPWLIRVCTARACPAEAASSRGVKLSVSSRSMLARLRRGAGVRGVGDNRYTCYMVLARCYVTSSYVVASMAFILFALKLRGVRVVVFELNSLETKALNVFFWFG